jgi:hypothetical protein
MNSMPAVSKTVRTLASVCVRLGTRHQRFRNPELDDAGFAETRAAQMAGPVALDRELAREQRDHVERSIAVRGRLSLRWIVICKRYLH